MSDGVIACHHPLLLDAQDICQRCRICERHERALCDLWRSGKTLVVGGKIHLAQEAIGNIDLRDAGKLELLWQSFLQRAEHALRAPTVLPANRPRYARFQADRAPGPPANRSCAGHKTGQLLCYLTGTTHQLTTRNTSGRVGSESSCPVFVAHHLSASGLSNLAGSEAVDETSCWGGVAHAAAGATLSAFASQFLCST